MAKSTGAKRYLKMIKPLDWVIVGCLMLAAFLPYVIFAQHESQAAKGAPHTTLTVVVKHDGKQVYAKKLTNHRGTTVYRYTDPDGDWNKIEIKDEQVAITEANCQDQVCVRKGWIRKAGQTIVCLPHKLLVEIQANHSTGTGELVTE